jgi:hypothetical protein
MLAISVMACTPGVDEPAGPNPDDNPTYPDVTADYQGFYVLNEGVMGANKATLDYFEYLTGEYQQDVFPACNPSIIGQLGDVGTGLAIYGSKMYAYLQNGHKSNR